MFIGAHAFGLEGPTPEYRWPEHDIELGRVFLTPPSGPSVGTAHHRQTAA